MLKNRQPLAKLIHGTVTVRERTWPGPACLLAFLVLTGCRHDMQNQPKYKPLAESEFFSDHRSSRPQVEGTVARGHLRIDKARYDGKVNNSDIDYFPIPIARDDVERGRQRYDIYCSPCHSRIGNGMGLVVLRGYRQPPSFYSPRLNTAPVGHFYDVITNGFGAMPSYATRVSPDDRWRVIAYVRALQLSMSAKVSEVPADARQQLDKMPPLPLGPFNGPPPNPAAGVPGAPGTTPAAAPKAPRQQQQ